MFTLTAADLVLGAIAAIIGGIIAERLAKKAQAVPLGVLAGALLGVLFAQFVFKVGPSLVEDASPRQPTTPAATATSPGPTETGGVVVSATPTMTEQPTQTSPTTSRPDDATAWTVSAASSDSSDGDPRGSQPKVRFWHYPGDFGDVRIHGDYGLAPEATGADCGNPYVRFLVAGVPKGSYRASAYVPDVPDLSSSVEYGSMVVDQSVQRGQWIDLGVESASEDLPGYFSVSVTVNQTWLNTDKGCEQTGRQVAFGPIRFSKED